MTQIFRSLLLGILACGVCALALPGAPAPASKPAEAEFPSVDAILKAVPPELMPVKGWRAAPMADANKALKDKVLGHSATLAIKVRTAGPKDSDLIITAVSQPFEHFEVAVWAYIDRSKMAELATVKVGRASCRERV